jgi:hypothetical protein
VYDTRVLDDKKEQLIELIKLQQSINDPWFKFLQTLKSYYLLCKCKNDVGLGDRDLEAEKNVLKDEIASIYGLFEKFHAVMQKRLIEPVEEDIFNALRRSMLIMNPST